MRKCKPSCDKSRYCTPTADHFPPELAVLSAPEREELALLTFYVQFVTLRGGKAPVTAKKRRGVISGRWKATSPDDSSNPKVRMALRWLLKNNALYSKYFDTHKKLLEVNVGETKTWSYIPTAMLLLRHHGVEVAAYPWLYPHGYMSDTSFIKANKNDKPSIKASWAHTVFGGFFLSCIGVTLCDTLGGKHASLTAQKKKKLDESPRFSCHLMSAYPVFGLLASLPPMTGVVEGMVELRWSTISTSLPSGLTKWKHSLMYVDSYKQKVRWARAFQASS